MRGGAREGGGNFGQVKRQSEELADARPHELNGPLHIGACRVGHYVGAAAGAEVFGESVGVIRIAVHIDDDNFVGLRKPLRQVIQPGREGRKLVEFEAGMLGDRAGDNLAALFVRSEKRDVQIGDIRDGSIPRGLQHSKQTAPKGLF